MQYAERQRDSEEAAEKAEGAGRLLLAMGLNRYFLNNKAALVLIKTTELFPERLRFNLLPINGQKLSLFLCSKAIAQFSARVSEFFLHRQLVFCSIYVGKYRCVCICR